MTIRPLTGQVLVEILPRESLSAGGITIPEHTTSPEEHTQAAHNPIPPKPHIGIVKAIGQWPKLKNGMAVPPAFGLGARVVVGHHAGIQMHRGIGEKFRMVRTEEVLAVLTEA